MVGRILLVVPLLSTDTSSIPHCPLIAVDTEVERISSRPKRPSSPTTYGVPSPNKTYRHSELSSSDT